MEKKYLMNSFFFHLKPHNTRGSYFLTTLKICINPKFKVKMLTRALNGHRKLCLAYPTPMKSISIDLSLMTP